MTCGSTRWWSRTRAWVASIERSAENRRLRPHPRTWIWIGVLGALGFLACSTLKKAFVCDTNAVCVDVAGAAGRCEASRFCAFPDTSCAGSGRRYGQFAGEGLAQTCVPGDAGVLCGQAGGPCCAADPRCNGATLTCVNEICIGCTQQIVSGAGHTCALKRDGSVYCWGLNGNGQLGNHTTSDGSAPAPVLNSQGMGLTGVIELAAGAHHTCALLGNKTIACWGDDRHGQLGIGGTDAATPVPTLTSLNSVAHIGAGGDHTCAVFDKGDVWCWGANGSGELGNNNMMDSTTPTPVLTTAGVQFAGVTAFAMGAAHLCAIATDHSLLCWGANAAGQLGTGNTTPSPNPAPISSLGTHVSAVAAGDRHTCALLDDGTISCFGANDLMQLGTAGSSASSPMPVTLPQKASALAAGGSLVCAVLSDGTGSCWGNNDRGQLGGGQTGASRGPGAIVDKTSAPIAELATVSVGVEQACARAADGTISCWGAGDSGALGNGQSGDHLAPTPALLACP